MKVTEENPDGSGRKEERQFKTLKER